jgi:acyl-coenzyme A synthetase/AMP-(fatty) acid ligase
MTQRTRMTDCIERDDQIEVEARPTVKHKAPEEFVVLDELPRTTTGKVDRTALKRMAESALRATDEA